MPISYETAQRIAAVWEESDSLREAMRRAGLKTTNYKTMKRHRREAEELLHVRLESKQVLPEEVAHYNSDKPYTIVVFSDAHFWPSSRSPAYRILINVITMLGPEVIVDLGDSLDAATISRHPKLGWEDRPTLEAEIKSCQEALDEISFPGSKLYRVIGNHDMRFDMRLANCAGEFEGVTGFSMAELFPKWEHCTAIMFNNTLYAKHRWKNGKHAGYNNTKESGKSTITGHLHRLNIRPYSDLNGTRYGIEAGTLANPYGPQFAYTECNPVDWQCGFIVITVDQNWIYPEAIEVKNKSAWFRGQKILA